MCGRYLLISNPEAIRQLAEYFEQPNFPPRYNVAPTQPIPIVRLDNGARRFALMRWGLLPSWVKDPKTFTLLINCRGESVCEKPAFKNAMKRRRCLIPADGFYEWKVDGKIKRPFVVRPHDGKPVMFAGLWETWIGPNGEEVDTAAIVTIEANQTLHPIHHRMPVILEEKDFEAWLDCAAAEARQAAALLRPAPEGLLEAYEISSAINRVVNDGPDVLEPYTAPDVAEEAPKPKRKRAAEPDDRQASLF
jgi:putative SOS response-associated peptidase YedK